MYHRGLWWGGVPTDDEKMTLLAKADRIWINEQLLYDIEGENSAFRDELARQLVDREGLGISINVSNVWTRPSDYWPRQRDLFEWCLGSGAFLESLDGDPISNWPQTRCFDPTHPGLVGAFLQHIVVPLATHLASPPGGWSSWFLDQSEGQATFDAWWNRYGRIPLYAGTWRRQNLDYTEAVEAWMEGQLRLHRKIAQAVRRPLVTNGTQEPLPSTAGRFHERVVEGIYAQRIWAPQYPSVTFDNLLWDISRRPNQGMVGTVWWGATEGPLWEQFVRITWGLAFVFGVGFHIRRGATYEIPIEPECPWAGLDQPGLEPGALNLLSAVPGGAPVAVSGTIGRHRLVVNLNPIHPVEGVQPFDADAMPIKA